MILFKKQEIFTNYDYLRGNTMEELNNHLPHYVKIKHYLRQLIANAQPHTKIPSELELAKQFQVSRGTAKQAIMDLVYEGLLYREQGKGTFIAERIPRIYDKLPSFTDDIKRAGRISKSKLLSFTTDAPAPRAKQFFSLTDSEHIIRYKRLIFDNNTPVALVISFLNPKLYGTLQASDIKGSLYETLRQKYGSSPTKAKDRYSFVNISPHTAKLLNCSENDYICYSERLGYLEDQTPAEFVESYIRADYFCLELSFGLDDECSSPIVHSQVPTHFTI